MKKTLLICDKYPLPEQYGGGMRTMNFVRFFKKYGDVDIAYLDKTSSFDVQERDKPFSREYLTKRRNFPSSYRQHFSRFIRGIPHPVREYSKESHQLLLSLVCSKSYDYIFFSHFFSVGNLIRMANAENKKIIIDLGDVISGSLYQSHFYPTKKVGKIFLRFLNKKLLLNYEKRCLKLGACLFCSEKESIKIGGVSKRENIFIVPNIYDNRLFGKYEFGAGFERLNSLLFLGSLDYEPNVAGLKWFLESIYGKFRLKHPNTRLTVVGKAPNEEVKKLCRNGEGIELNADVPDVKEYYERCGVVVVPILSGGGTRIKILEAALAGRPVLSTPMGADGLDLRDGKELLLFENIQEFCLKYAVLNERKSYNSIIENAKAAVSVKYSKEIFDDSMRRVIDYIGV